MANDRYGRNIHYLRISLTDMCNLRCVYCMPEDMSFRPSADLLQDEEIIRLVRLFAELGFDKFRLTGGEPTVRENMVDLVRRMAGTPGLNQLAMTTNGVLLKHLARPLVEAGLQRLNISLDTLDPAKFKQLTRWGHLEDVWAGIEAAEAAGLGIKLNAVVVRGLNDRQDAIDLARLTLDRPWQVRYIEVMPFGSVAEFQRSHIVPEEELRATISGALGPLTLLQEGRLDGEARLYKLANGARGVLGFISSVTKPFCAGCNRARLTADGKLRMCLLRDKELDLMPFLRNGAPDDELKALIEDTVWYKPWGHGLAEHVYPRTRVMSEIGG
jgi:cyclic pyranopterin phosphate synthase